MPEMFWKNKGWEATDRHLSKLKQMPFKRRWPFIPEASGGGFPDAVATNTLAGATNALDINVPAKAKSILLSRKNGVLKSNGPLPLRIYQSYFTTLYFRKKSFGPKEIFYWIGLQILKGKSV